jgi:transcriptional regulator with XRE-family HTH domain
MDTMGELGQAIRTLRTANALTQKALAEKVNVSPTYLSHVEAGRREPSVTLLRSLARALGASPGLFIAIVLSSDLPSNRRSTYQAILNRLVELEAQSNKTS